MSRDQESLIDISTAIKRIQRYTDKISRLDLESNDEKLSAVLYQIAIIGEATKRLSQTFRQQHPEIAWREMAGMRDVIVHEYDQLDFDVVWDIVENKLSSLQYHIEPLL
ncbi:HepT-like ribonuclease domain-containing protein [Pseudanabaena minima]|uniref:HepT-like ribonuclease domain-containing protein n=1 Tax=Pseudanabaena minima TaxID=890415 RepID=UPI003DA84A71